MDVDVRNDRVFSQHRTGMVLTSFFMENMFIHVVKLFHILQIMMLL